MGEWQGHIVQEHIGQNILAHPFLENTVGHSLLLSLLYFPLKKSLHAAFHTISFYLPTSSPILST